MWSPMAVGLLTYGLVINVVSYAAMATDKAKARQGARRISETTLLKLALLGGSVGTVLAQQTIRHKTREEPFRSRLIGILIFQLLALIALWVAVIGWGPP